MPLANSIIMPIVQMTDSTKPIIDVIKPAVAIVLLYCFAFFDIWEASMPTIPSPIRYPKKAKKCMTVTKSGKVTLKKKAKKGTYKIRITAAKTSKYQKAVKYVTVKVK